MEKNILPFVLYNQRQNFDVGGNVRLDNLLTNIYFEKNEAAIDETQKLYAIKRPGVSTTPLTSFVYSGYGCGCFSAQPYTHTNIYTAVKDPSNPIVGVFHYNGTTTTGVANCLVPTYNRIDFVNIGLPDDTYTVAWTAQKYLYLHKSGGAVAAVEPTGGSADLTRPVYLNNRVFVGDRNTGRIYQSGLGNYTTYSASEFITVEAYGGKLVDIVRYNNFIAAFKEYSIEFFEDVANPNGSVLGRVGQALQQIGCVHPHTIVDTGSGELIWLGNDESGNRTVKVLRNSFEVDTLKNSLVDRYLNLVQSYNGTYGYLLNVVGKQFYVLNLKNTYFDASGLGDICNVTFAYDFDTKIWTHWMHYGTNTTINVGGITYQTLGRWIYAGAIRNIFNTTYVQNHVNGHLYQVDDYYGADGYTEIPITIQITNIDFGTRKRKFLNSIELLADSYPGVGEPIFTVSLLRFDSTTTTSRTLNNYPYKTVALGSVKPEFGIKIYNSNLSSRVRIYGINVNFDVGDGHGLS